MIEFLTYCLCAALTIWYLREPAAPIFRTKENINQAVDEWNSQEFIETENCHD